MHLPASAAFWIQSTRLRLAFTCEECAYFCPATQRCSHEYPTALHRRAFYDAHPPIVVFCKEFEPA